MSHLELFWIMSNWVPKELGEWLLNMPITDIEVSFFYYGDWLVTIEGSTEEATRLKRKIFNSFIEKKGYGPHNSRM